MTLQKIRVRLSNNSVAPRCQRAGLRFDPAGTTRVTRADKFQCFACNVENPIFATSPMDAADQPLPPKQRDIDARQQNRELRRPRCSIMSELVGVARFRFHDNKVEDFKQLSAECMQIVRTKDTGTLQYSTYFNDDESECIVIERYKDASALLDHLANVSHLMEPISSTASIHGELLGAVDTQLKIMLEGSPVRLFANVQSE